MAIISSLSNRVISVPPVPEVRSQSIATVAAEPSSQAAAAVGTGGNLQSMQPHLISPLTWKIKSSDPITSLMTINYGAPSIFSRFDGLGAAALQRLGTDPGDFSQSVSQSNADAAGGAQTAYQISLNITMANNVTVQVSLESKVDGLALQISSSGKLGAAERAALSHLADGFQKAIDGMADTSKLDFSGLLQYDHALVSSIDLQATVQRGGGAAQTQTFHADDKGRSFSTTGQDGNVSVAVDLRQLAVIGHANVATLTTFKAAFTQMIGGTPETTATSARPVNLSEIDHAFLTGLPDFSASMADTPDASNPMRPGEVDTFSYQVSQHTAVNDSGHGNRSISQKQHAHLEASFHEPLPGGAALALDSSRQSQNYYFKRLSEDIVSDTNISYNSGMLEHATTEQHIRRSTQVLKYVMGMLTDESTLPEAFDDKRDLLKDYFLQSHT
jgi:hypothetical protein